MVGIITSSLCVDDDDVQGQEVTTGLQRGGQILRQPARWRFQWQSPALNWHLLVTYWNVTQLL